MCCVTAISSWSHYKNLPEVQFVVKHKQPVAEVLDRLGFKKVLYDEARKWMILWRQRERTRTGGESSHGFLYRYTCTHKTSVTRINTRFFVNCGVREGNWRRAYCLHKAWGIVEAHGHYYDLSLHMHEDSCSVLQNLDTVRRLKSGPSKHTTLLYWNQKHSKKHRKASHQSNVCLQILHHECGP